jgi:hypothetical protein
VDVAAILILLLEILFLIGIVGSAIVACWAFIEDLFALGDGDEAPARRIELTNHQEETLKAS